MGTCYLDENVTEQLIGRLAGWGHSATAARQAGNKGKTDVQQLSFAVGIWSALVTHDGGHFSLLHEAWLTWTRDWGLVDARHPGILVIPDPGLLSVEDAARVLDEAFREQGAMENRLLTYSARHGWQDRALK